MLEILLNLFRRRNTTKKLLPEADIIVSFDDECIESSRPDGLVEKARWSELKAVLIETTDDGPFAPDVFWVLIGENDTGCVFPTGATGAGEIMKEMQKRLNDFDNESLIKAMASCENNMFLIWKSED